MVRDFETVRRSLLRKAGWQIDKSSYPFISGDTYKALCDFEMRPDFTHSLEKIGFHKLENEHVVFVSAQFAEDFHTWLTQNENLHFINWHLILHNWDDIPSVRKFKHFSTRFQSVGANHWHGDLSIAKPLPIGLENWDLQRNGIPRDFAKRQKHGLIDFESRPIEVLCSFSVNTNVLDRAIAWDFCQKLEQAYLMPSFTTPRKYRTLVEQSKFVISPPGNGADCHRTWEALYLGAVPVVLKSSWGYSHWDLPVIAVDEWADAKTAMLNFKPRKPITIEALKQMFLDRDFLTKKFL